MCKYRKELGSVFLLVCMPVLMCFLLEFLCKNQISVASPLEAGVLATCCNRLSDSCLTVFLHFTFDLLLMNCGSISIS